MNVRLVRPDDRARWDDFCRENGASYGCFFEWQEVQRSWGREPLFLLAEQDDGRLCGCLPLVISRGVGAWRAFSIPVDAGRYGGPIVTVPEAAPALLKAADEVLRKHGVAWVAVVPDPFQPHREAVCQGLLDASYTCTSKSMDPQSLRYAFRLPVPDADTVWRGFDGAKRTAVNKAKKLGVVIEEVGLDVFCREFIVVQQEVWRRHGNGCPYIEYLRRVLDPKVGQVRMYLAKVGDLAVGGLYAYCAGQGHFGRGMASKGDYASYRVNDALYWRAIQDACAAGLGFCDFGSTPPPSQSGHYHWKTQFSAQPYPFLAYLRVLRPFRYFVDRSLVHLTDSLSNRLSWGGTLSRLMGPVGRLLVDWRCR